MAILIILILIALITTGVLLFVFNEQITTSTFIDSDRYESQIPYIIAQYFIHRKTGKTLDPFTYQMWVVKIIGVFMIGFGLFALFMMIFNSSWW